MIAYKNSCCIATEEQLTIKGKRNIDLAVRNTILRLSNALYIPDLIVNFINIAKFWRNRIGVYLSTS